MRGKVVRSRGNEQAVQSMDITATSTRCHALYLRSLWYPFGANGPTIFWIGAMCSSCIVLCPICIPGRPSMLKEFFKAQYLAHANSDGARARGGYGAAPDEPFSLVFQVTLLELLGSFREDLVERCAKASELVEGD